LVLDKKFGFLKETFVAPVSRFRIMIGQTLGGATIALIQGILIFMLALVIGVPVPSFLGILQVIGFMFLIGIAFTAVGISFASQMEDTQGFTLIINFVIFPFFFLSGALFPLSQIPDWLNFLVYCDPLTYGVEGIRLGMMGEAQIDAWLSFGVLGGFTIVMILIGGWLFQRIKL
jgi:ABC-2 type transport system permease protein